ncbi:MAG: efflux RND transporter periplasmic adaptor subunit [Pseudomonadota bacterium]
MTTPRHLPKWIILAALCLPSAGCSGCSEGRAAESAPRPSGQTWLTPAQAKEAKLETQPVRQRELASVIAMTGKLTFSDLEIAHVFSPVSGRVTSIKASLGQRVKKGDTLAIIESPDLGLALANLEKADADLVAARHNFEREKELADAHAVSQHDFESAQDDYNKAQAELSRCRQMIKILHAEGGNSSAYSLRTSVDGEIISRAVNPGMEVQGQYGGGGSAVELFTVGELDPIWVLADVYEMDLPRVKVGDDVEVSVVSYQDRKFHGRIDWISGTLDPISRTAKVRCTLANPERLLRPEMYATVSVAGVGQHVLSLARTAILHLGDQTLVFKDIGPGAGGLLRFQQVPVEVDEDIPGEFVRLKAGLAENDVVVASGALLLTNQ